MQVTLVYGTQVVIDHDDDDDFKMMMTYVIMTCPLSLGLLSVIPFVL